MKFSWRYTFLVVMVLALGVWGVAVNVPHTFTAGDVISSAQVNANFDTLETAVTATETAVTSLNSAIAKFGSVSFQETTFDNNVDVTSTVAQLATVSIPAVSGVKVSLSAHAMLEVNSPSQSRYDLFVTSGDCTNTTLNGRGWLRPFGNSGFQADTIAFTAFDTNVTGPKTYVLCAVVFSGVDASVSMRGLTAIWTP